jgi:hypothetical protein
MLSHMSRRIWRWLGIKSLFLLLGIGLSVDGAFARLEAAPASVDVKIRSLNGTQNSERREEDIQFDRSELYGPIGY